MGFFDQVVGRALSGALGGAGSDSAALVGHVLEAFGQGGQPNGLSGLLRAFHTNGLGQIVESWIGTGENLPVSRDQIAQVLGQGVIQQLARTTGMSAETLSATLTEILPMAVDKLTPDGKIPESGMLAQALDLLKPRSS